MNFDIAVLKVGRLGEFLMGWGREFHRRGPSYCNDFSNIFELCLLISNIDHMRISGTEPSSVYLSQTRKLKSVAQKVPKQAEAKRDGIINP